MLSWGHLSICDRTFRDGRLIRVGGGMARTHKPILASSGLESVVESCDSTTEMASFTTDSVIVGQLFNSLIL